MPGVFDSYFLYDQQDKVLCETTTAVSRCPSSGSTIKNVVRYTGAGDRHTLLRPIEASSGGLTHTFTLTPGSHKIASIGQSDGTPVLGATTYTYDGLGSRTADNAASDAFDWRRFTYDERGNLAKVTGWTPVSGVMTPYTLTSAFDGKNRRVMKSFKVGSQESRWYFYYDALDRLTEVHYTPTIAAASTYTTYQLLWLNDLLVAYWQTDAPAGTTTKRYVEFDETGRPVRMHEWLPGNSTVSWAVNPDAWGYDRVVVGQHVYQPLRFAGQYVDQETTAYRDDGVTVHRPALVLNGHRTYDPFTGSYLQLDPLVHETWSSYTYADNNPVGNEVSFVHGPHMDTRVVPLK
jgi:RHS repeat-associated protein